jgi:hypothetical protein
LYAGSKVEVELAIKSILDESVIRGYQSQRGVFLWKVIAFSVFRIQGFPLRTLSLGREVLFWRVVRLGVGGKTGFWCGEWWSM